MSAVGRDAAAPFEVDRLEGARIGPYRVERLVSTGGAGAILAARHAESGQEVALKLLRGLEPEEQEGLRREVHVLSRLSHHGVVRVYDAGVHAIGPWYAMELIRGETLAARWGSRPALLLSDSLRILRDLSETLAFVHGEGIVHRDLKPANLMLRAGQAPVLVDFGFASHAPAAEARELLERTGQLVGSLAYASPEQIRGEQVDARSDLYSLGCMLFEAAAGHPPFGSEGPNLLLRHLAEPSPDLLRAAPSAPPQLAALVASLLSKNPRDRVGYAEDVARELSTLLPGGRQARDSSAPAYLYRPHFVGREEALASFDGALESAKAGAGRALLVTAESGAGKTRLAREVTARAADHGFEVVLGNCVPTSGTEGEPGLPGAPLHPFSALLRAMADHCRHEGPEMTHAIFGAGARILVSFEPSIATVPGFDALPTPPPLSGEAARSRTIARLQDALRAFGQRAPLLLVLDDLQWADEMTLSALRACTRIVGELPLVLVATARSEEMPDAMHELGRWPAVGVMDLERLGRPQIAAMVSDMLAIREPPEDLVSMLTRESEGNPFFVAEYVRAAVAEGHLRRVRGRWQATIPSTTGESDRFSVGLPRKLRDLAQSRLRLVPDGATPLLEAAAVLGGDFDPRVASSIADLGEEARLSAVATLLKRKILEEQRGRLHFSHDKLREVAYSSLTPERRTTLHLEAARVIELRHTDGPDFSTFYPSLAHHWWQGGDAARAVHYFDLAGSDALERGAYRDAHTSLLRAEEIDPRAREAGAALRAARRERLLCVASFGIADLAGCIQHGREALLRLGRPLPRAPAEWWLSAGRELARRALGPVTLGLRLPTPNETRERALEAALTYSQLATSFFFAGSSSRTLVAILLGLRYGEKARADRPIVDACARLGFVTGTARLRPVANHYFARARRGAERLGDPRARGIALYFEAMHGIGLGDWEKTRKLGDRAAALLEESGDAQEAEVARTIAAHGFFYPGDVASADERVQQVLDTAMRRGNAQHTCWGRFLRARSELVRGRTAEALELARSALTLIEDLPDTLSNVMLEGTLALAALRAGQTDEALAACQRLTTRLARGESPGTGQCIDGVAAVPDVLLSLREARVPQSEMPGFEQDLERALNALRSFARIFPIARPAALRCQARVLQERGREAAARRAWRRSARAARRLQMPVDEAHVHLDLSRFAPDAEARHRELAAAHAILEPIGCADLAADVRASTGARASGA